MAKSNVVGKIVAALKTAKAPSTPWFAGTLSSTEVGLEIEQVGEVELPLRPAGLRKLCEVASQAPYGKRTDTVVDTNVRDTLQVDAEVIKYSAEFAAAVDAAAQQAAAHLQLDVERLQVELYKLLIYAKGGFFLPHRDSEKRRGMVATMIVVLPSRFSGGELIVQHNGRREVFSFPEAQAQSQPQYAAFFADCQHEVKKVRSGVRVCLAFNLILKPKRKKARGKLDLPADSELLAQVRDWMRQRPTEPLVFALEHQYTAAGLTPSLLKGADKTLYNQLDAVSKLADARLHFGQVSRHLFLYADDGNYGYGRYGYDSWSGDYDDLNVGEVIEDQIIVDGWKDDTGKPVALDALGCEVSQLICATDVEQWTPTQQDYEGYTGNAGNTLERWYHKSAIVLWDCGHHFEIITQMGLKFAVSQLRQMRAQLIDLDDDDLEQACDDCQQLAESIIRHWPDRTLDRRGRNQNDLPWLKQFANELPKFDDPELIAKFFQTVSRQDWSVDLDRCVVDSLKRMGPAEILPLLRELIEFEPPPNQYGHRLLVGLAERDAAWLLKIATTKNHCGVAADELQGLLSLAAQKFITDTKEVESSRYRDSGPTRSAWSLLCKAVMVAGCQGLAAVLQLPRTCPRVFDLRTFQVSAATALRDFAQKRLGQVPEALEQWIGELRQILQRATREKPQPPSTLSRPSETGCDCKYCVQLSEFLKHPEQKRTRIAARADRRDHLTQVIHAKKLDVTTKLVRTGSPYSLELTKTTASYQADLKRFQADQKLLKTLE